MNSILEFRLPCDVPILYLSLWSFYLYLKVEGTIKFLDEVENSAFKTKSKSKYRALNSKVILGFHIDSKLKWKFHIDNNNKIYQVYFSMLVAKAPLFIRIVCKGCEFGTSPIPRFIYGLLLWGHSIPHDVFFFKRKLFEF